MIGKGLVLSQGEIGAVQNLIGGIKYHKYKQ